MKHTQILILITFLFSACHAQTKKPESFEGTLTYKVTFTPNSDNADYNEYQKQKNGNEVKYYIAKNGNYKKEYLNSGPKGFVFFIYNISSNRAFSKWRNIDTVYSFSCSKNSMSFVSEKDLPSENIYGQLCEGYLISGIDPKGGQHVSLTYYYPKDEEYINPDLYKDYNDFFYNKVIEKIHTPFYKLVMDMEKYTVTFEIEKIEPGKVDSGIFEIPAELPVKEK